MDSFSYDRGARYLLFDKINMGNIIREAKEEMVQTFKEIDKSPKLHWYYIEEMSYHNFKSVFCKCFPSVRFDHKTDQWIITHRRVFQARLFEGLRMTDKDTLDIFNKHK